MSNEVVICELDHVIVFVDDLSAARQLLKEKYDIEASLGGGHPDYGTRNAIVSMGQSYFELVSADRNLHITNNFALEHWAMRSSMFAEITDAAQSFDLEVFVHKGRRDTPDGETLTWRSLEFRNHSFGGALPFFIDWGDTPNPAQSVSISLTRPFLEIKHPEANLLNRIYTAMGISIEVQASKAPGLIFSAQSQSGQLKLKGDGVGFRVPLGDTT